jgi:hypothetical protein
LKNMFSSNSKIPAEKTTIWTNYYQLY